MRGHVPDDLERDGQQATLRREVAALWRASADAIEANDPWEVLKFQKAVSHRYRALVAMIEEDIEGL